MKRLGYFLFLLLLPIISFAADNNQGLTFTPPQSDVSMILLSNIFGIVGNILHGTGSQILGEIFRVFNAAVLTIGGVILFYIFIVSTLNTAHAGEVLGRNWSSMWIPIRALVGIVLLLPQNSGYCLAQIFVMWLVVQGVGAGDQVWGAALDYLSRGGVIAAYNIDVSASAPTSMKDTVDNTVDVASQMLAGLVCVQGLQKGMPIVQKRLTELGLEKKLRKIGVDITKPIPNFASNLNFNRVEQEAQQKYDNVQLKNLGKTTGGEPATPPPEPPRVLPFPNQNAWGLPIMGVCGRVQWQPINLLKLKGNLYGETEDYYRKYTWGIGQRRKGERPPVPMDESKDALERAAEVLKRQAKIGTKDTIGGWSEWLGEAYRAGNKFTLSKQAERDARNSRAAGLQQMFQGLNRTAETIVLNFMSPNPLPLGHVPTAEGTEWDPQDKAPLLTGYELKNAALAYLGIMKPTLNALNGAIKGLNFINEAKKDGWIMAGSYFFSVAQANANINELREQRGKIKYISGRTPSAAIKNKIEKRYRTQFAAAKKQVEAIDNFDPSLFMFNADKLPDQCQQVGTDSAISTQISCYIDSAKRRKMRSAVGTKGLSMAEIPYNPLHIPDLGAMDCSGWFCLISIFYNAVIVNTANSIFIPLIRFITDTAWGVIVLPLAKIFNDIIYSNIFPMFEQPGNPIILIAQAGDALLNATGAFLITILTFAAAAGSAPFVNTMPAILLVIMPFLSALLLLMGSSALMMAYYIPLIPYVIFTFAALGWFIGVIEAMAAAPLVALGIAHPEGHEAFGKAEQAIMLLLSIFLRPAMMVIGLVAAIILSYAGIWLLNEGFTRVVNNMLAYVSGISSILGPLAVICIYAMLSGIIVQKSFSLIHTLPDKVMRWLAGGAQASFGEEAGRMVEEAKGVAGRQAEAGAGSGKAFMDKFRGEKKPKETGDQNLQVGKGTSAQVKPSKKPGKVTGT